MIRALFGRPVKRYLKRRWRDFWYPTKRSFLRRKRVSDLLKRDGNICSWCKTELKNGLNWSFFKGIKERFFPSALGAARHPDVNKKSYVTVDHIVPKCKGGSNEIGNLRLMHRGCNMERARKDHRLFRE